MASGVKSEGSYQKSVNFNSNKYVCKKISGTCLLWSLLEGGSCALRIPKPQIFVLSFHRYSMSNIYLECDLWVVFRESKHFNQGHHQLSRKSDENKSFWPSAPSIYIMIELCYFSLDQWEIRIHLLWGKCFNIPHWPRSHSTNGRLQNVEELSKSKTRVGIVTLI